MKSLSFVYFAFPAILRFQLVDRASDGISANISGFFHVLTALKIGVTIQKDNKLWDK